MICTHQRNSENNSEIANVKTGAVTSIFAEVMKAGAILAIFSEGVITTGNSGIIPIGVVDVSSAIDSLVMLGPIIPNLDKAVEFV